MTAFHFLLKSATQKIPRDWVGNTNLDALKIPKATIFGTADWYQSLRFDQQKCIYILWNFLTRWQNDNYPYYAANYYTVLNRDTYDWLFSQVITRKHDITRTMNLEILLGIKELMSGAANDSFQIDAVIKNTPVYLKFKLNQDTED